MPKLSAGIDTVVVSPDGAMIPMADSAGYREAMAGMISFYDPAGGQAHTIYLRAAAESGKREFNQRMTREIDRARQHYPEARYLGIADGASSSRSFLDPHTEHQLLDSFHVSEYVGALAQARYRQRNAEDQRSRWQHQQCTDFKQDPKGADRLIAEAATLSRRAYLPPALRDGAYSVWAYFNNDRHQMDYPRFLAEHLLIVSGVTEAACKALVKQRLCASGKRWKTKGAKSILGLRSLVNTTGSWAQFWEKIDQFGAKCYC